jgi:hypothetical protein
VTVAPVVEPESGTVENALLGGRVRLRQPVKGYRAGMDAALLAAAIAAEPGQRVIEAGCGAGAVLMQAAARRPGVVWTIWRSADPATRTTPLTRSSAGDAAALAAKLAAEASLRRARGRQERHRLKRARTIASREARQLAAAAAAPAGGSGLAHAHALAEDSESEVD